MRCLTEKEFRQKERNAAMKKAAEKRKRRKRKRAIVTVTATLIILAAILIALLSAVLFKVETISVEGNSIYSPEQIIAAAGIEKGNSLVFLSEKQVSEKVQKALPFIIGLDIEKRLPSGIHIKVEETKEEQCFYYDGIFYTSNKQGKILEEYGERPDGMTVIISGDSCEFTKGNTFLCSDTVKAELLERLLSFANEGKHNVTLINVSDIYDSYMVIDDRLVIELGSSTYLEQKMEFLAKMLRSMTDDEHNVVDISDWTPDNDEAISKKKDINSYIEIK